MKTYQSPEVLFEGISPMDILTVSFSSSLFNEDGEDAVKNSINWGQINGDAE